MHSAVCHTVKGMPMTPPQSKLSLRDWQASALRHHAPS